MLDPQPPLSGSGRPTTSEGSLDTWKEIAAYLSRDQRTVKRWERSRNLPVHRLPGGPKSAGVYALKSEIDEWRQGHGVTAAVPAPIDTAGLRLAIRWATGTAAAVLIGGLSLWLFSAPRHTPAPHLVPVTNYRGVEWFPAFSPDGKQIAFSWNGEHEDNYDIYVKLIGVGDPVRLTRDPAMDLGPVWSPDGRYIAFFRWSLGAPKVEFFVVPALGGAERWVFEESITPNAISLPFPVLAWAPEGNRLIRGSPLGLTLFSIDTGETRQITSPPSDSPGDCCPTVSPDGQALAFLRASRARTYRPMVVELARNGEPSGKPLPLEIPSCENPAWSSDGSELFCVVGGAEDRTVWRIPVRKKGTPQPLSSIGQVGHHLAVSPRGGMLVYSTLSWEGDIWQLDLSEKKKPPTRLIASTADELRPRFSPNGRRIAFLSNRSDHLALWVSDNDGTNASELARASALDAPAWSPDGQQIAYTCRSGAGAEDICIVRPAGGLARQLTSDPARDIFPAWSRQGAWVYFTSDRSGSFQIWKTRADGTAAAVRVTSGGGFAPLESEDGRFLYYTKGLMSSPIWRVPVDGGDEVPIGGDVRSLRLPQNFAVGNQGLLFASSLDPARQFELRFYSFSSKKTETIARIEGGLGNGIDLSVDGRSLLFCIEHRTGDLIAVENFR